MPEQKRKFNNPTPGWIGAVVYDAEGKPHGVAVEPGGSIWLSEDEERMTAEAPRLASDNPFVQEWECAVEWNNDGEIIRTEMRTGVLTVSDEPPRVIASERFTPSAARAEEVAAPEPEPEAAPEEPVEAEEITGAPPLPKGPAPEGQPAPDEIVATPEAVPANDEALAARAREQAEEEPTRVDGAPADASQIGVRRDSSPLPV